jgi:hypothetical protein
MADQRRRGGRGRSGRGGKIPRRGEGQSQNLHQDEAFVSFPLEIGGPIRVNGTVDDAAVEAVLRETVERERAHAAALAGLEQQTAEPVFGSLRADSERHRTALEQLARELGIEGNGENGGATPASSTLEVAAEQARLRLGWQKLQIAAYAAGDKRIDRVVKPVLREKERHAEVLAQFAVRATCASLFREPEY